MEQKVLSTQSHSENTNIETTDEMSQEAISTVYSDYAVDIVTNELENAGLLKLTSSQPEGNYVQIESPFSIIDPISIGANVNLEFFMGVLNWDDSTTKELSETSSTMMNALKNIGEMTKELFPNSILLKTHNSISIAQKNKFRMNGGQLRMLSFSKRKITVLGKIESVINETDFNYDDESEITQAMTKFSLNILHNLADIKPNDKFIKPLAIYFK